MDYGRVCEKVVENYKEMMTKTLYVQVQARCSIGLGLEVRARARVGAFAQPSAPTKFGLHSPAGAHTPPAPVREETNNLKKKMLAEHCSTQSSTGREWMPQGAVNEQLVKGSKWGSRDEHT